MMIDYKLLTQMCRHCNNWFTVENKPRDFEGLENEIPAGIPFDFMDLHDRIKVFNEDDSNRKTAIDSETWVNTGYSKHLAYTSWQVAFADELNLYKRPRFL